MSDEENKIYIFVKGRKGKYAYIINNNVFEEIHSDLKSDLKDDDGNELHPNQSDREAMIKSLEYVIDNRGKLVGITKEPIVHLITTFELNYQVATDIKKPADATRSFKTKISLLRERLKTDNVLVDDRVKIIWVPKGLEDQLGFADQMKELESKFETS